MQGTRGQGKAQAWKTTQLWPACVDGISEPTPPQVHGPGKLGLQWSKVDPSLKEQLQESAGGAEKLTPSCWLAHTLVPRRGTS